MSTKAQNEQMDRKGDQGAHRITEGGYVQVEVFFVVVYLLFFFFLQNHKLTWALHSLKSSGTNIRQEFFFSYNSARSDPGWLEAVRGGAGVLFKMCFFCCMVSMHFVFPLLVFFVFLLAGTFHTEPLLVLGRGSVNPHTRPVVPVITVITPYHGTAVVSRVTSRTDPDLVAPFVSDHVGTDSLSHHAAHWRLEGTSGGEQGGGRQHWWRGGRRGEGRGRRDQQGCDWGEYRGRRGCPRAISWSRFGSGDLGCRSFGRL